MISIKPVSVGIFIFNDVEVLDFTGPFEVFSTTRKQAGDEEQYLYSVSLIGPNDDAIKTRGGMEVKPHFSISSHPPMDRLIIPGGYGTRPLMHHEPVIEWIRSFDPKRTRLASVCTGSLLLASAGHLDGKRATTHWTVLDMMEESFPEVQVDRDSHVIIDETVLLQLESPLVLTLLSKWSGLILEKRRRIGLLATLSTPLIVTTFNDG